MPRTVFKDHSNWSNLHKVPVEALGLTVRTHQALKRELITTVGVLIAHSLDRFGSSGIASSDIGNHARQVLVEAVQAAGRIHLGRNLDFAKDCRGIPVDFIVERVKQNKARRLQYYSAWTPEQAKKFFRDNGLTTLDSVFQLQSSRSRLARMKLPTLDEDAGDYRKDVAYALQYLLWWYGLASRP